MHFVVFSFQQVYLLAWKLFPKICTSLVCINKYLVGKPHAHMCASFEWVYYILVHGIKLPITSSVWIKRKVSAQTLCAVCIVQWSSFSVISTEDVLMIGKSTLIYYINKYMFRGIIASAVGCDVSVSISMQEKNLGNILFVRFIYKYLPNECSLRFWSVFGRYTFFQA